MKVRFKRFIKKNLVNNGTECPYTNGTDTLTWSLPPSGLCGTSYEQVNGTLVYSNAITGMYDY